MPLIPLSLIMAVLSLLTEILKAFNALPEAIRVRIVTDILDDKDVRDALWERFTLWIGGLFKRVEVAK